jgi:hypothetical protein
VAANVLFLATHGRCPTSSETLPLAFDIRISAPRKLHAQSTLTGRYSQAPSDAGSESPALVVNAARGSAAHARDIASLVGHWPTCAITSSFRIRSPTFLVVRKAFGRFILVKASLFWWVRSAALELSVFDVMQLMRSKLRRAKAARDPPCRNAAAL